MAGMDHLCECDRATLTTYCAGSGSMGLLLCDWTSRSPLSLAGTHSPRNARSQFLR
jgi:hypothetical protein